MLSVCVLSGRRCSIIVANSEHLVLQKVIKVCLSLIPKAWEGLGMRLGLSQSHSQAVERARNETRFVCSTHTICICNPGIWIAHIVCIVVYSVYYIAIWY